ncbi:MAG TPA: neutral zinc metallopeptidase [Blastocatellia bacterium]|nr:neutral zinc metallopeptidase [Blastocatellia bacterium]
MRWVGRRQSENIEDRRGMSRGGVVAAGGGLAGLAVLLVSYLLGVDVGGILPQGGPETGGPVAERAAGPEEQRLRDFSATVLADTEDVWNELFRQQTRRDYPEPTLVLFTGGINSGCGSASSATGPFYCPSDRKVYLDLSFFEELARRFRAAGDFAQAYVIAHEVGHHVQNQFGVLNEVHSKQGRVSEAEYNRLSVRLELQADFLAGVWAHHAQRTKDILEPGDIEEALTAASAIGDDRLQRQAQGYVVPDAFTHGTSEQRVRWFKLGFDTGDLSKMMETFRVNYNSL